MCRYNEMLMATIKDTLEILGFAGAEICNQGSLVMRKPKGRLMDKKAIIEAQKVTTEKISDRAWFVFRISSSDV
jgi:hypothetical protein